MPHTFYKSYNDTYIYKSYNDTHISPVSLSSYLLKIKSLTCSFTHLTQQGGESEN